MNQASIIVDEIIKEFKHSSILNDNSEIEYLEQVDSTNKFLLNKIKNNKNKNLYCFSFNQTNGVGQRGCLWQTPDNQLNIPGFATLSVATRLAYDVNQIQDFSLLIGAYLSYRLEFFLQGKFKLGFKLPNDLMLFKNSQTYKIGGILIESIVGKGKTDLVIGVGINLNQAPRVESPQFQACDLSIKTKEEIVAIHILIMETLEILIKSYIPFGSNNF